MSLEPQITTMDKIVMLQNLLMNAGKKDWHGSLKYIVRGAKLLKQQISVSVLHKFSNLPEVDTFHD